MPAHRRLAFGDLDSSYRRTDEPCPRLVTWQETFAALDHARRRLPKASPARWFAEEFLAYLDTEGLMPPPKLTRDHLRTLKGIAEAQSALDSIVHGASAVVEKHWRVPVSRPRPGHGYAERAHDPGRRWDPGTLFVWGVDGRRAFTSVLGSLAPGPLRAKTRNAAWLAHADRTWDLEEAHPGFAYWTRYEDLEEAARGRTADDQAAHLAAWVLARFEEFEQSAVRDGRPRSPHRRAPAG